MTFSKKWVVEAIFKKICRENQNGEARRNAKFIGRWDFFIFIFSLLTMMVTDAVFRRSCLENLFQKNGPWYF